MIKIIEKQLRFSTKLKDHDYSSQFNVIGRESENLLCAGIRNNQGFSSSKVSRFEYHLLQ
jgi:hypothetical protein